VSATRESIEQPIQQACARGDYERAATLALDAYGREVLGFLIARIGEQRANDVFSELLEDFWRGLSGFAWRSTLRSWIYTLARHALSRHARGVKRIHEAPFDSSAALSLAAQRIRTDTAAHLRTPVKNRFRQLRAQLSEDDQTLLILRIDRNLTWRELAVVMSERDTPPLRDDELDKLAARLRQRFQAAKERLRKLAEAEGLLPANDDEA